MTNSANESLRWQIGVANLEDIGWRGGQARGTSFIIVGMQLNHPHNGEGKQVRKLHDARTAGHKVVVVYWGLQNCLQQGTYIQAVVKIRAVLRG